MKIILDDELNNLKKVLLEMGNHVEEAMAQAIKALKERDVVLAKQVIKNDVIINRLEIEVEKFCLKIFALKQPIAIDLRFVASSLEIKYNLERMGDLSAKIAESAIHLGMSNEAPEITELYDMTELVQNMVKLSLEGYMQKNEEIAKRVIKQDKDVDNYYSTIIEKVGEYVHIDSGRFEAGISYINIAKCLERIGDHCKNICESTIYLTGGEIVKHKFDQ